MGNGPDGSFSRGARMETLTEASTTLATSTNAAGAAAVEHAEKGINVVLSAEHIGSIFGFPITNSLFMTWTVMAVLLLFAWMFRNRLALIPGKLQAGVEWLFEGVLDYMTETLESEKLARAFFPLIMSIFLFIFVGNEMAFIPGVGSFGLKEGAEIIPLFRAPSADLNFALALAFISFVVIEITGAVVLGFLKYSKKYLNFSSPIQFVVGLLELVSNIGRLVTFSFRLFGNIFAGEVMILVAGFFLMYLLPVPLMAFELFVGFIQAVVFAMLTLFFIKLSIAEPHGDEAH